MDYIGTVTGGVFKFDSRKFGYDWTPGRRAVSDMLTDSGRVQEIYTALHISASTKRPVFQWSAAAVKEALTGDALRDYSQYYNYLITENFPLLVMVGEYDMLDGYMGQTLWMKETLHTVDKDFWVQDRKIYSFAADTGASTRVGGYYRQAGNFTFLTVPKAGHFLPGDNILASLAFLDDYVNHGILQCRGSDSDCRVRK